VGRFGGAVGAQTGHGEIAGLGPYISTLSANREMIHTTLESWFSWLSVALRVLGV